MNEGFFFKSNVETEVEKVVPRQKGNAKEWG